MQVYQVKPKGKMEKMMSIDEFRINRCQRYGETGWFDKLIRWIDKIFKGQS